jgi:DNA-binding transcriptional ArsR family regulator
MDESTETESGGIVGIRAGLTARPPPPDNQAMEERLEREVNQLHASICQALADPKRILILYELHEGPKTVTELTEALKVPQPTVSRHLKMLREQRLVFNERDGVSIRYSLADDRVITALDTMRAVLIGGLAQQAELAEGLS